MPSGVAGRYLVWLSVGREGERYIGGLRTYTSGGEGAGGQGRSLWIDLRMSHGRAWGEAARVRLHVAGGGGFGWGEGERGQSGRPGAGRSGGAVWWDRRGGAAPWLWGGV